MIRTQLDITKNKVWYSINLTGYQTFLDLYQYMQDSKIPCYILVPYWWSFTAKHPPSGNFEFKAEIGFKNTGLAFKFFLGCPDLRLNHKLHTD